MLENDICEAIATIIKKSGVMFTLDKTKEDPTFKSDYWTITFRNFCSVMYFSTIFRIDLQNNFIKNQHWCVTCTGGYSKTAAAVLANYIQDKFTLTQKRLKELEKDFA